MHAALLSYFRDSTGYLPRYFAQAADLRTALESRGHTLTLVLVEGDSTDGTWTALQAQAPAGSDLSQCHHGGPKHGSVVSADRFRQLAQVGNHGLSRIPADADAVAIVESDLIWNAGAIMQLLNRLAVVPAVAPMVILRRANCPPLAFYDTFAYRKDGVRFVHHPPYHPGLTGQGLTQLDSAGSCLAMRGDVARGSRYTEDEVFVGLCAGIRARGGSIWLDPTVAIYHE
jgi:hypothetical protein